MDFRSKKEAYNKMQGATHFEADQALLKKTDSKNPFAGKPGDSEKAKEKLQREILWILLDLVSVDEIEANRKNSDSGSGKTELELKIELIKNNCAQIVETSESPEPNEETIELYRETYKVYQSLPEENKAEIALLVTNSIQKFALSYTEKLTAQLEKVTDQKQASDIYDDIVRLASLLPKETSDIIIEFAQSKNPFYKTPEQIKAEKIEELKALNLEDPKCDFKAIDAFFKFFELKAKGKKKAAKIVALKAFLETLPKEVKGESGEINGKPGKGEKIETPETKELEETEEEKEELEEKNEELQDKVDELESEKKNIPENSQKNSNTPT